MKKNLILIFTIILCFCFTSKVDALSCLYKCEGCDDNKKDINIAVQSKPELLNFQRGVRARALNDFIVGGEAQEKGAHWDKNLFIVKGTRILDEELDTDSDECYKFLYYDKVKNGPGVGANKFYFSNDIISSNSGILYDVVLETIGNYEGATPSNSILDEMFCTYSSVDDVTRGAINISFKISNSKYGIGTYTLYNNYEAIYSGNYDLDSKNYEQKSNFKDYFSIRNFWNEETGVYSCPNAIIMNYTSVEDWFKIGINSKSVIEIGYDLDYMNAGDDLTKEWYQIKDTTNIQLTLNEDASYINYTRNDNVKSQICAYTKEEEQCNPEKSTCVPKNYITLTEYSYSNSIYSNYVPVFNSHLSTIPENVQVSVNSGVIKDSCNGLPIIYTNCLNGDRTSDNYNNKTITKPNINANDKKPDAYDETDNLSTSTCIISEQPFKGGEKLVLSEWTNTQDITDVIDGLSSFTGDEYKMLVCDLSKKLSFYSSEEALKPVSSLDIYDYNGKNKNSYNINSLDCSGWGFESEFTCDDEKCKQDLSYTVNKKIREIYSYCNSTYKNTYKYGTNMDMNEARRAECKSFEAFYSSLVQNGIVQNLFEGCDIISDELSEKLVTILNIIKFAGPILAVVLGMMDFLKVLVAGDADKEMKQAGTRFKNRLIAAVLLFLVPVLLSTLINIFIGDEINNNPYCGWLDDGSNEEKEEI